MIAGRAAAAPVLSHANAAVPPRPKRQSHWGQDGGTKNARDGGSRSGSGQSMAAGHSRPDVRPFERYGVKPATDRMRRMRRMGTRPVARRPGHGLGRLARCERVAGASRHARAQPAARVEISHVRCIRPITSIPSENTRTRTIGSNIFIYCVMIYPI